MVWLLAYMNSRSSETRIYDDNDDDDDDGDGNGGDDDGDDDEDEDDDDGEKQVREWGIRGRGNNTCLHEGHFNH